MMRESDHLASEHTAERVLSDQDMLLSGLSIHTWLDGFEKSIVSTQDGAALNVYCAGVEHEQTIIMFNPVGMSVLLLAPLMRVLAKDHRVIAWETRGLPSMARESDSLDCSAESHVRDCLSVVEAKRIVEASVVGYCSGCGIAAQAIASDLFDVRSAVFVSPSMQLGAEVRRTDYQANVIPAWAQIYERGRAYSHTLSSLLAPKAPQYGNVQEEIDYVTRLPFLRGDWTYVYSKLLASIGSVAHDQTLSKLDCPIQLVHACDDELIDISASRYLQSVLRKAELTEFGSGGHYAVCTDPYFWKVVSRSVRTTRAQLARSA